MRLSVLAMAIAASLMAFPAFALPPPDTPYAASPAHLTNTNITLIAGTRSVALRDVLVAPPVLIPAVQTFDRHGGAADLGRVLIAYAASRPEQPG